MTPKQAELYRFICGYIAKHDGVSPSYREMMDGVGLASKNGAHRLLHALRERGYVDFLDNRARSIRVLPGMASSPAPADQPGRVASVPPGALPGAHSRADGGLDIVMRHENIAGQA